MFFSCNVAFSSLPPFLPTVINESAAHSPHLACGLHAHYHRMGYPPITSQILSAPPYLAAFGAVLYTSRISDRHGSRGVFVVLSALVGAFGYAMIAVAGFLRASSGWRYCGIFFGAMGFFSDVTLVGPFRPRRSRYAAVVLSKPLTDPSPIGHNVDHQQPKDRVRERNGHGDFECVWPARTTPRDPPLS